MTENVVPLEVPLILRMSRRRSIGPLLGSAAFVLICALLLVAPPDAARPDVLVEGACWLGLVFFGVGVVLFAAELLSPSRLTLDRRGFSYQPRWRRKAHAVAWTECSPFSMWEYSATNSRFTRPVESVMFHVTTARSTAVRRVTENVTGGAGGEGLRAGFGGLGGAELAALLNRYRDAYASDR